MKIEKRGNELYVEMTIEELVELTTNKKLLHVVDSAFETKKAKCRFCKRTALPDRKVCIFHLKRLQAGAQKARSARKPKRA